MRKYDRLLLVSLIGWLVFLNVGWMHQLPFFTAMPTPSKGLIETASLITRLGNPLTLIYATVLVVVFLIVIRSWLTAAIMILNMLAGWALMDLFKSWWAIPRPLGEHLVMVSDFSYPSGHAMLSLIFYGFLAWYLAKEGQWYGWSVLLLMIALLVGISRPFLNVHFPADVIGGWAAGIGWLSLMLWLYYQLANKIEKKGA